MEISVGARNSRLSRAQVEEVYREISAYHPSIHFNTTWVVTEGDIDKTTPLWKARPTFFTQQIDDMQLQHSFRVAVHSAKDLPQPLSEGLSIVALTKGVDRRDSLVMQEGMTLETLPFQAKVGSSSKRREQLIFSLRSDLVPVDIRGTIDERLRLLNENNVHALIVAEAALIRLELTHLTRMTLNFPTENHQGQLAVVARSDDLPMKQLFALIDTR
jgi:hydroxymethylbilane synthase